MSPAVTDWARVNWQQPWLAPLQAHGLALAAQLAGQANGGDGDGGVATALNALAGDCPVRFAAGDAAPPGEAYEAFIRRTGQVPTRDNLHDLFNGLVWMGFPATKARLNVLQSNEIARQGVGAVRGPVRDAITLFDENGAVLLAPEPLWQALLARDWVTLFVTHRALWCQARLVLFGHALMEQLVSPRKNITAHVLVERFVPDGANPPGSTDPSVSSPGSLGLPGLTGTHGTACPPRSLAVLDAALAAALSADVLAHKPFTPLPVLGTPGWWPANDDPRFYADTGVFRPPRPR